MILMSEIIEIKLDICLIKSLLISSRSLMQISYDFSKNLSTINITSYNYLGFLQFLKIPRTKI